MLVLGRNNLSSASDNALVFNGVDTSSTGHAKVDGSIVSTLAARRRALITIKRASLCIVVSLETTPADSIGGDIEAKMTRSRALA